MYPKASEGMICPDKTNRKWAMVWYGVRLKNEFERNDRAFSCAPPPSIISDQFHPKFDSSGVVIYKHLKKPARFKVRGRDRGIARVTGTKSTTYERSQSHTEGSPPSESPKQPQSLHSNSFKRPPLCKNQGDADSDTTGNGEERDNSLYNNAPAHGNN